MNANFDWMEATSKSPIFMILVLCSVITLAVALERTLYYWKRRGSAEATLSLLLEKLRSGGVKEAAWVCQTTAHPMGRSARQLLENPGATDEVIEEKLLVSLSQEKLLLERNLGILGSMAATTPLIGLLGTVWGIMRAFHDMSLAGSAAPTVVAGGVAEALITTAAGLVVAIPAAFLYNHFTRRMNVMLTEAENHTRNLRAYLLSSQASSRTESGAARIA